MRVSSVLVFYVLTISSLSVCNGEFLNDMPTRCYLCAEDHALNGPVVVDDGIRTCEQVSDEASQTTSDREETFLSLCLKYQEKYQHLCCLEPTVDGSSTTTAARDNIFLRPSSDSTAGSVPQPPVEPELESISDPNLLGVRREDPWSDATKSWPNGYLAVLVVGLALVP